MAEARAALDQAIAEAQSNVNCFAAGTPLLTPRGARRIEDLRPGDLLLSRAESDPDGPVTAKAVEAVFVRVARILHLHVGGQVVRTTGEHPFWVVGRGWTPVDLLAIGAPLLGHDGQVRPVEDVLDTGEYETVYNVRVADYHTYFVGSPAWGFSAWAHNAECAKIVRVGKDRYKLVGLRSKETLATGTLDEMQTFARQNGHPFIEPLDANLPQKVKRLQAEQDKLIANQQTRLQEAYEAGGRKAGGVVHDQIGEEAEQLGNDAAREAAKAVGAEFQPGPRVATAGKGQFLDGLVEKGDVRVYIETKYSLPTKAGEALDRAKAELSNAAKLLRPGDKLILNVARPPTAAELEAFEDALPKRLKSKITYTYNLGQLYQEVQAAFGK